MNARCDRVRIDYTASVNDAIRLEVLSAVEAIADLHGLFVYQHYDKSVGAWSVDVTPYDRTAKHPISDSQVLDLIKSIADEKGLSLSALLQAAKDA